MNQLVPYNKRLTIYDIYRNFNEKKNRQIDVFEKILSSVNKKIKNIASKNQLNCFCDIPDFVLGYPLFNLNACITYIANSLMDGGFLVKYYFPKTLYVSWDLKEVKSINVKNKVVKNNVQVPERSPNMYNTPVSSRPTHKMIKTNSSSPSTQGVRYKSSGKLTLDI